MTYTDIYRYPFGQKSALTFYQIDTKTDHTYILSSCATAILWKMPPYNAHKMSSVLNLLLRGWFMATSNWKEALVQHEFNGKCSASDTYVDGMQVEMMAMNIRNRYVQNNTMRTCCITCTSKQRDRKRENLSILLFFVNGSWVESMVAVCSYRKNGADECARQCHFIWLTCVRTMLSTHWNLFHV